MLPFFPHLLVYLLDNFNSNCPWKTWSKLSFFVKTNHSFLPFVSSTFTGPWEEFPFYPMATLPMSVSLFLILFREMSQKPGYVDNGTIGLSAFLDSLKHVQPWLISAKHGFFCDRLFHKSLFILQNNIVCTRFCDVQCQNKNVVECFQIYPRRFFSSFYPFSPQLCCSLPIWLTLHVH